MSSLFINPLVPFGKADDTPSSADGVAEDLELALRESGVSLIQRVGMYLEL